MPPNPNRREHRAEVIDAKEKIKKDLAPALNKLESLRQTAQGQEQVRILHTINAIQRAMLGLESTGVNAGKIKIQVEGQNGQVGGAGGYDQFEGVPIDEVLDILKQAHTALPANHAEKLQYEAIIQKLEKNSKGYFEQHYNKSTQGIMDGSVQLTPEESTRQDLRVRHEAKLISTERDYRASTNPDQTQRLLEDYQTGQRALDKRREYTYSPIELPTKVAVVEASHSAEVLARMRADEQMTKLMNEGGWLSKRWNRAFEEGKRQALYEEELRKISGKGKKHGWFGKKILRRKDETDEEANLFIGTGKETEHNAEMTALAKRFAEGYVRNAEGEQQKQLTDPAFETRINDLVFEFASGNMTDAEFDDRKTVLVQEIQKKYPESFKKGVLTADNFLEAGRTFRKYFEHAGRLSRADVQIQVVLGEAKSRIKNEANLTWSEGIINKVKQNAVGKYVSPATIGYAVSAGGYILKKPLAGLLGAGGLGGLFGGIRRSKQVKEDVSMHRREREIGLEVNVDPATSERRAKVEKFVNKMEKASGLITAITTAKEAYEQSATPENRAQLLQALANAESRMSVSATRQRGLIEYDGETGLERSAMNLMKEIAEGKVLVGVADISTTAEYKRAMRELEKDVHQKNTAENKYRRWEVAKAVAVGTATGLVFGTLAQEATDEAGEYLQGHFGSNRLWNWMDRPDGSTALERAQAYVYNHRNALPGGSDWWDWTSPDYKGCAGPFYYGGTHEIPSPISGSSLHIDKTLEMIKDPTNPSRFFAVDASGTKLQEFGLVGGKLAPVGTLNPELEWSETVGSAGKGSVSTPGTRGSWWDTAKGGLAGHTKDIKVNLLYDNDSPTNPDLNELRFYMSQDASGNIKANLGDIKFKGSYHQGNELDWSRIDESVKLVFTDSRFANPIVLEPGNDGTLDIPTELKPFIHFNPDGTVTYKGDGWMGMVEERGEDAGKTTVNVINSIRGNNSVDLPTGGGTPGSGDDFTQTGTKYELLRKFPEEQCEAGDFEPPMFVPLYRRHPLEMRQGNPQAQRNQRTAGETVPQTNRGTNHETPAGETPPGQDLNRTVVRQNPAHPENPNAPRHPETPHTNEDDDDNDEAHRIQTERRQLTEARTAQDKEKVRRVQEAVREFNKARENRYPHIQIKVETSVMIAETEDVIELIRGIEERIRERGLRNDRFQDRNFVFKIQQTGAMYPEVSENDTETLKFTPDQEPEAVIAIFNRYLSKGITKTREDFATGRGQAEQQRQARQARQENNPQPANQETPQARVGRMQEALINSTNHRVHFEVEGEQLATAEQASVMEAFTQAWGELAQDKKDALLAKANASRAGGQLATGLIIGFPKNIDRLNFDNRDRLVFPANATKETIKTFLETAGNPPAQPQPAGNQPRGGNRGGGGH